MKKLILILFLLFPIATFAQSGTYIQGELGSVYLVNTAQFAFGASSVDGRISAGHLWGDKNINYGLEAGLGYFPHANINSLYPKGFFINSTSTYSGYAVDLLGVLKYYFNSNSNVDVFGKAGFAYLNQTAKENYTIFGMPGQQTNSGSKIGPEIAIGAGYQLNQAWELTLTESSVIVVSDITQKNPVAITNTTLLGLTYRL